MKDGEESWLIITHSVSADNLYENIELGDDVCSIKFHSARSSGMHILIGQTKYGSICDGVELASL